MANRALYPEFHDCEGFPLTYFRTKVKEFITDVLTQFKKGRVTLEEAADRLLIETTTNGGQKSKSNRRLKSLCNALQREENPAGFRELKTKLSQEFYHGDQIQ